jgi:hypothetical protein
VCFRRRFLLLLFAFIFARLLSDGDPVAGRLMLAGGAIDVCAPRRAITSLTSHLSLFSFFFAACNEMGARDACHLVKSRGLSGHNNLLVASAFLEAMGSTIIFAFLTHSNARS